MTDDGNPGEREGLTPEDPFGLLGNETAPRSNASWARSRTTACPSPLRERSGGDVDSGQFNYHL
jgi:hypothetical protein